MCATILHPIKYIFPFSERKGYTAVKNCLKFVCPSVCVSKPIRNELFYFSSFWCSDKTLLEIIDIQECESEVGFPRRASIGQKLVQSETSFSIFHLFDVLIKLCFRLSMPRNPNPRLAFFNMYFLIIFCGTHIFYEGK